MSTPEKRYPRSSSFYAYDNCDAAFELSVASGEDPPTPYAEKGTRIHAVLSGKLPQNLLDDAEADLAADIGTQRLRLESAWLDGKTAERTLIEQRLWLRLGLKPLYSGQPDKVTKCGPRVLIPDFKTGWHPLDHIVATNCQLRSYVPLAAEEFGDTEEVTVAIHKPGKKSPPAVFNQEQITDARAWALDVVSRATAPGPKKPNRGPWCTYCSGKVLCPLWRDEIAIRAQQYELAVRDIPDVVLRELAPNLGIAATVIEKLQSRLEARVKEVPENFPDWRFESGDRRRSIDNVVETARLLIEGKYLGSEEFLACCRLAITELEAKIRKANDYSNKETDDVMKKVIGHLINIKPNKDKLVYDPKPKELANAHNEPAESGEKS